MIPNIVAGIKAKRELSTLDDKFVQEKIEKILQQNKKLKEKVKNSKSFKEFSRSSEFEELKKLVRAELRSVYGVFDLDEKKGRGKLLDELEKRPHDAELIKKLLLLHQSSKERISYYKEIYAKIFSITGVPRVVLDLGCGANPYSYAFLGCKPLYLASDLPSTQLDDVKRFFQIEGIDGEVFPLDLVKHHDTLPVISNKDLADVAFLFKLLDTLEEAKRNISGKVLDSIPAKWLVVSFPTKSLGGGKTIKHERRAWFEKLVRRKAWAFEKFAIGDEEFYVVLKKPSEIVEKFYSRNAERLIKKYDTYTMEAEIDYFRHYVPRGKILDVGCGNGRDLASFAKRGYDVAGVDREKKFVVEAKRRVPDGRIVIATIDSLPFPENEFDGLWACAVLVHSRPTEAERALQEWQRVLKSSGIAFLTLKEGDGGELAEREGVTLYFHHYTAEDARSLLERTGFHILREDRSVHQGGSAMGTYIRFWVEKR